MMSPGGPRGAHEEGFTLIELVVVVLIIGILAEIAIPVFLGQQDSAKDAAVKSDLTSARIALVSYATANDGRYVKADGTQLTAADLITYGFAPSPGTSLFILASTSGGVFCMSEASSSTGHPVWSTTDSVPVAESPCP